MTAAWEHGPDVDGSWNARLNGTEEVGVTLFFFGVFNELPWEVKKAMMEGALEALNKSFENKPTKKKGSRK